MCLEARKGLTTGDPERKVRGDFCASAWLLEQPGLGSDSSWEKRGKGGLSENRATAACQMQPNLVNGFLNQHL